MDSATRSGTRSATRTRPRPDPRRSRRWRWPLNEKDPTSGQTRPGQSVERAGRRHAGPVIWGNGPARRKMHIAERGATPRQVQRCQAGWPCQRLWGDEIRGAVRQNVQPKTPCDVATAAGPSMFESGAWEGGRVLLPRLSPHAGLQRHRSRPEERTLPYRRRLDRLSSGKASQCETRQLCVSSLNQAAATLSSGSAIRLLPDPSPAAALSKRYLTESRI